MHLKLILIVIFVGFAVSVSIAQESKNLVTLHQAISTPDFGYLPTLVRRSKGMFVQEGIDLKLIVVSARLALPALLAKEVQFATAGSTLAASLRGAPLKAVFFTYKTSTIQSVVRPDIASALGLRDLYSAMNDSGDVTAAISAPETECGL